jgi:choline-sulfatase
MDGMRTVAHHLGDAGYRTACFGHMHWQRIETNDGREDVFPDHGYQEYGAVHHDLSALEPWQRERHLWERMGPTQSCTAGASVVPEEQSYSKQIADAAIAELRGNHRDGRRFLNWTSFNDPHPPFFPPAEYYRRYAAMDLPLPRTRPPDARPTQAEVCGNPVWAGMTPLDHRVMRAGYFGLVELADRHLGRVLDALDELDLWKDTMIIFTVDHGEMLGDFGRYMKSVMWEPAVHMPLFVYHPDAEPGERRAFAEHVDLYPTICEYLGLPIPPEVQGRSLLPLVVSQRTPATWREYAFSQLDDDLMIRTADWKLIYRNGRPAHLFDVRRDPDEYYDVVHRHAEVVRDLSALLDRDHPGLFERNETIRRSGRIRKKKRKPKVQLVEVP